MAASLAWRDLKQNHLAALLAAPAAGKPPRVLLASFLAIDDPSNPRSAIELDLLVHALNFGRSACLHDDQLSALVSIAKDVHAASVEGRMTLDASFSRLKETLIRHSVDRPPFSVGLFTLQQVRKITDWMLDTYYRHYKLYQYAFGDRVTLNFDTTHVGSRVEAPLPIPPLADSITEEEHEAIEAEKAERKREEDERMAAEEAERREEERQRRLREAYEAAIPEEVKERVEAAVGRELERVRGELAREFEAQEGRLTARLAELQGGQ
eukprot:evm.model.scf_283.5 EVM.evm.TU.scf_283.5   scf_283:47447-48247(+)